MLLTMTGRATAQSLEGSAQAYLVQSHIRFGSTLVEQSGQWVGAEAAFTWHWLRAGVASAFGALKGDADALHPDSRVRATAISVHGMATSWLALGVVAEARVFTTDAGTTAWRLIGVNVHATPSLDKSLEGLVDVSYWPAATVIGGESMSFSLRTIVGATYFPGGGRLGIRAAYRLERFDFPAGAGRLEQFRGATLGALLRLGR